jgi:hypothetical protein
VLGIQTKIVIVTNNWTDKLIRQNKLILSNSQQLLILAWKAQYYQNKAAYGNPFNGANDRQAFKNLPETL